MAEFYLGEPIFEVLRKVRACVDDRHLKIMAEFDLAEPNFEVLRKVSACDDDRHFSKTLHAPKARNITITDVLKEIVRARSNAPSIPRAVLKAKW